MLANDRPGSSRFDVDTLRLLPNLFPNNRGTFEVDNGQIRYSAANFLIFGVRDAARYEICTVDGDCAGATLIVQIQWFLGF